MLLILLPVVTLAIISKTIANKEQNVNLGLYQCFVYFKSIVAYI